MRCIKSLAFLAIFNTSLAVAELSDHAVASLLAGKPVSRREQEAAAIEYSHEWAAEVRAENDLYSLWDLERMQGRNFQNNNQFGPKNRAVIEKFSRDQLPEASAQSQTVFYPFGGPDVIFPSLFFPNMKTLILVGLESPGHLPQLSPSTPAQVAVKMREIRTAYIDLFERTYFITKHMTKEISEFGTATMISVGLVLLGNEIESVRAISLSNEGQVHLNSTGPNRAVQIIYKNSSGNTNSVYYFQQNLSNGYLNAGFQKFVKSLNIDSSFYKAASYLSHYDSFSKVNELAQSARFVIQTDTGIPYREFEKKSEWEAKIFGHYITPDVQFDTKVQSDYLAVLASQICRARDKRHTEEFRSIWGRSPCEYLRPTANVEWGGLLPFRYDYAGFIIPASAPRAVRNYSSNLMYFRKVQK